MARLNPPIATPMVSRRTWEATLSMFVLEYMITWPESSQGLRRRGTDFLTEVELYIQAWRGWEAEQYEDEDSDG